MSGFFRKRPGAHIVLQTTPTLHLAVVVTTCYNVFVQRTGSEKELQYVFIRPEGSIRALPLSGGRHRLPHKNSRLTFPLLPYVTGTDPSKLMFRRYTFKYMLELYVCS